MLSSPAESVCSPQLWYTVTVPRPRYDISSTCLLEQIEIASTLGYKQSWVAGPKLLPSIVELSPSCALDTQAHRLICRRSSTGQNPTIEHRQTLNHSTATYNRMYPFLMKV